MKKHTLFLFALMSLFLVSCSANMMTDNNKLFNTKWELEFITGPRITFQGLFPDNKPMITFNKMTGMVNGTSSCNPYNTAYKLNGSLLTFEQPAIATTAYCGDGEVVFLKTMQQITHYKIEADGKLTLLMGDTPMMTFKKSLK